MTNIFNNYSAFVEHRFIVSNEFYHLCVKFCSEDEEVELPSKEVAKKNKANKSVKAEDENESDDDDDESDDLDFDGLNAELEDGKSNRLFKQI